MTITDNWYGLYRAGWKNLIVNDAFQHPAKFARNLIKQIYDHCLVCHWLEAGDTVIDPFGGVALGGLDAMRLGLNWTGVELEPKFVDLGNRNIALWNQRYGDKFMRWGTARLVQGDSRRLLEVIAGADACVSSPPYADQPTRNGGDLTQWPGKRRIGASQNGNDGYGDTPGQLASLREGDLDAAISSPPFSGDANLIPNNNQGTRSTMNARGIPPESQTQMSTGNLAALRADDDGFAAAVSSPPYEGSIKSNENTLANMQRRLIARGETRATNGTLRKKHNEDFIAYSGGLGGESGPTFWAAARIIVAQTFAARRPCGVGRQSVRP